MDSRTQFEEWFDSTVYGGDLEKLVAWEAWQASRECVVIELPEKWGEYTEAGSAACDAIDECAENIHATGIRTK